MTRYRLRPCAWEQDGDACWIGALPYGPVTRIDGVGMLVLDLLAEQAGPVTVPELIEQLHDVIEGLPEEAEKDITEYLTMLASLGIVEVTE